ncbi:MAG: response regulator [Gammaproteobacteria bacterium]|nr:MAG: response regulator [Gammaproteobacteria bacterium]
MTNKLILIVEDNEKNRRMLRDILQVNGYQTVESETAEDGIRIAQQDLPALVLMDIQLPGMNGMEARKMLRNDPVTRHIPVVAVTASAMLHDQTEIEKTGFDAFHYKPIRIKEILKTVHDFVEKSNEAS